MLKWCIVLFTSLFLCSGCLKGNDQNCDFDPCTTKAPASEQQAVEAYIANNNITGTVKHCSGLYYRIETAGTGRAPGICNVITIRYKGQLTNGTVFDQTTVDPVSFGMGQLIAGWQNGLPLLKEGGKIFLYVPPSLGYGNQANGSIPANSILIFEISLLSVS